MAQFAIRNTYQLELTVEELRLILKALGGRLINPEEIEEAKKFGDELTKLRATVTKTSILQMDNLLNSVKGE